MPALQGYVTNRNLDETQVGLGVLDNLGDAPIGNDIALFKNNLRNTSSIDVSNSNINSVSNTIKIPGSEIVFGSGTKVFFNNYYTYYIKNSNGKDTFQLSSLANLETTVSLSNSFSGTYVRTDAITPENIRNYAKKRRPANELATEFDNNTFIPQFTINVSETINNLEKNLDSFNSVRINAYITNNDIITDLNFLNQGHTIINDPDNLNDLGVSKTAGPGIFVYNFVANTIIRAFSDTQNVWAPNLANTYLETTAEKITVGSLKVTKDDIITIEQKAGTNPALVTQGVSSLGITDRDFTHTVKVLINGEEYFLCMSNSSVVSLATNIETVGSVTLKVLLNGNYAINDGAGDITITNNGQPVSGTIQNYSPIYATSYLSGYAILWRILGTNSYFGWQLDSSGAYTNNIQTPSLQEFELLVDQDANGDGLIAYEGVVENRGNAILRTTKVGNYVINTGGADIPITNSGQAVSARTGFFGYFMYHIEPYQSGYLAYLSNGVDNLSWVINSSGQFVSSSQIANVTQYESLVNSDVNGDGVIGYARIIESNGNARLKLNYIGNYIIERDGEDIPIIYNNNPLVQGTFAPNVPIQVEPYSGGYALLWRNSQTTAVVCWFIDADGEYDRENQGVVSSITSIAAFETATNSDANGNGIIGA